MEIIIPFGKLVKTANLKSTVGTILFEESTKVSPIVMEPPSKCYDLINS